MKDQGTEWQEPPTPWQIVRRRFFDGQGPDITAFSQKHSLDEAEVRRVFSGIDTAFTPELCTALSRDTGMSEQFFRNLSDQHQQRVAA
jgi:plasmid maintenance system antidote protein VapI